MSGHATPTATPTAAAGAMDARSRLAAAAVFVGIMMEIVLAIEFLGAPVAAVLTLGVCAALLLWREIPWHVAFSFYLGVLLFIPVNVYRLPVSLPLDVEPQRVVLFGIAAVWFAALLIDPRARLRATGLGGPALLLIMTAVVSMVVNAGDMQPGDSLQAVKSFAVLLSILLVCLLAAAAVADFKAARAVARWLVIIAVVLSLAAFFERFTRVNLFRQLHTVLPVLHLKPGVELAKSVLYRGGGLRVSGSAEHPIAFGAILTMVFPFAAYRLSQAKGLKAQIAASFAVGLIGSAALLTGSRTVVLGLAAILAFVFWDQPRLRVVLVACGILGLFLVHMLFPGTLGGFRATLNPSYIKAREYNGVHGRGSAYPVVAESVRGRPLVGIGFGRWDPEEMAFTDNQYLQITAELGILGLVGFVWFVGVAVVRPWRVRRAASHDATLLSAFAASCAAFGAMSLTYDTLGFPQGTYLFFALAGIGCGLATTLKGQAVEDEGEAVCGV